jgi:transposase
MLKFSSHIRWQIIEKSLAGISKRQIAIQLGISKSTVRHVYRHFKQYGYIENLPSLRGRPRIFGYDDMKYLETLLKEKVDWYIWELQSQMEFWLGRNLDLSVIWKAIHRLGYTYKQVLKIYKYYILHSLFTVLFH